MKKNQGFTLVEVIVVLTIIAILGSILVPRLTGMITQTNIKEILSECRLATSAGETICGEKYIIGTDAVPTSSEIKEVADVPGRISKIEAAHGSLVHLSYGRNGHICTYCKEYQTCANHDELYSFTQGELEPDDPSNPDDPPNPDDPSNPDNPPNPDDPSNPDNPADNSIDYFYIGGNTNYKVNTLGDLEIFTSGSSDQPPANGSVFYWQEDYYIVRDSDSITETTDRENYIKTKCAKINISGFVVPSASTKPGDIQLKDNKVQVFFPYSRYPDDYNDNNYWIEMPLAK